MKRYRFFHTLWTAASPLVMARTVLLAAAAAVVSLPVLAQQPTIQPQQGQSAPQMNSDMAGCASSASQVSGGYNPAQPPATSQPQVGGRAKGAAAGAAAGAVGGKVRGNQYDNAPGNVQEQYTQNRAQSGAAAGAVVGGVKQRQGRRETRQETSTEQQAANTYNQTYASCLQARGYVVK